MTVIRFFFSTRWWSAAGTPSLLGFQPQVSGIESQNVCMRIKFRCTSGRTTVCCIVKSIIRRIHLSRKLRRHCSTALTSSRFVYRSVFKMIRQLRFVVRAKGPGLPTALNSSGSLAENSCASHFSICSLPLRTHARHLLTVWYTLFAVSGQ